MLPLLLPPPPPAVEFVSVRLSITPRSALNHDTFLKWLNEILAGEVGNVDIEDFLGDINQRTANIFRAGPPLPPSIYPLFYLIDSGNSSANRDALQ